MFEKLSIRFGYTGPALYFISAAFSHLLHIRKSFCKELTANYVRCVQDAVKHAVFEGPQGLMGAVGGDPRDCTVLVSGLPGGGAAALSKSLTAEGVAGERILFCDFF